MSRKSIVLSLLMVLVLTALAACSSGKGKPLESGDITKENVLQVCEILNEAGLSNVDVFEKWVKDSASGASEKASEMSGFTDADCRMTVMLLAGELIKYDSVEEDYNGTYLMFDMDAIENKDEYSILKEKKQLFTTMFGEMAISNNGFAETLPENWSKHGINVESDKCSVISILFKAYEEEAAFVGHTGILIDCRNIESVDSNYLFVEKIAFGDPFKITLFKDENDLIEMLSERSDYTSEEGDPAPVVYKNGERIYSRERAGPLTSKWTYRATSRLYAACTTKRRTVFRFLMNPRVPMIRKRIEVIR